MKITYKCQSCRQEMKMDENVFLDHLMKFHPKKVNNKRLFLNGYVQMENENK